MASHDMPLSGRREVSTPPAPSIDVPSFPIGVVLLHHPGRVAHVYNLTDRFGPTPVGVSNRGMRSACGLAASAHAQPVVQGDDVPVCKQCVRSMRPGTYFAAELKVSSRQAPRPDDAFRPQPTPPKPALNVLRPTTSEEYSALKARMMEQHDAIVRGDQSWGTCSLHEKVAEIDGRIDRLQVLQRRVRDLEMVVHELCNTLGVPYRI